ncbi:Metallo-dependent phosphatase [Trichocladium antarcticum]|uniref:Metallo-dependent phosphatase n=1 Tax=Trichocladium antarcticum TaxID=1450529 RepID=A0AAN6ZGR1_9PEZI|nr:Metallo-dependent phosphatase [Trichocladium antarcticum]
MPVLPPGTRPTRRTRIVCISDTHNSTVKLPKGDVLLHAGDLTNQGSYSELSRAVQWLEKADFEAKIVIAGNHDITLDCDFYSRYGPSFHNQDPQDHAKCLSLLTSSRTITYLQHNSATIRLTDPDGPGTEFTVFGSPYSPEYGLWAFTYRHPNYAPAASGPHNEAITSLSAAELWATVPEDIDVLVTHTPASTHCDNSMGCEDLRRTLARVRPRLHVCGHVHRGRSAERVRWDTDSLDIGDEVASEAAVEPWQDPNPDPGSAKMSLVDLTGRGGKRPLEFQRTQSIHGKSDLPEPLQRPQCTTRPDPMGHLGRRETCVVNCSIMATSWPHVGGKRFNKPIVVDVDLPVWR